MLRVMRQQKADGTIALMGATLHLLGEVHEKVSSTQIRGAAQKSEKALSRYVPPLVAAYIKKERLYIDGPERDGANGRKMLSFEEARHQGHGGRSHRNG